MKRPASRWDTPRVAASRTKASRRSGPPEKSDHVLDLLRSAGPMTSPAIAKRIGHPVPSTKVILVGLIASGHVERVGNTFRLAVGGAR